LRAYIKWLKAIVVLSVLLVAGLHIGAWSIDSWSAPRAAKLPARSPIALNDLQQALDTEFAPVVKDGLLRPSTGCGVAIGIIDHGQRRVFTYGAAQADSIFEIGSVTKTFTGLALAQLAAQGKVRLDEPIRPILFPNLDPAKMTELLAYLRTPASPAIEHAAAPLPAGPATEYHFTGYNKFLDPDGYPAIAPPWGTLSAIDMNTGKYLWKIPLGEYPALAAQGLSNTGSENYGGPIVTAGGLVFIGATVYDRKFRAFDAATGQLLWETTLPFAGIATPATYSIDGKQYVVIAASGGRDPKSPVGGSYIAFSLP